MNDDKRPFCDRFKKRSPEFCCDAVFEAFCECGRVYRRCANHGGIDGAIKSRGSHRGIDCKTRGRNAAERRADQTVSRGRGT